jgi:hypothetical protein
MKNLKAYVDQKNAWETIFGKPALDINNPADRQKIADSIDSDLSPENLTCDGEADAFSIRSRFKLLTEAAKELKAIDSSVTFVEYSE